MPHLSVSARFTLKDMPKDQPGVRSMDWNFGKDRPLKPHRLAMAVIITAFEMYSRYMTVDELNAELDKLRLALSEAKMEVRQNGPDLDR